MLAGLLRLRRGPKGSFYIWRLLWKQVGHCRFQLAVLLSTYRTAFDVLQGVIWLAIATAAELPQAVSPASFIFVHMVFLYLSSFCTGVVAALFEFEW
jgi:hypothetical protein